MRGAPSRMQPVVRPEGGGGSAQPANVISFARAQTAREEERKARAVEKQRLADAALAWSPDRTEPSPRVPDMPDLRGMIVTTQTPAPLPKPPVVPARAVAPTAIPKQVIAEGSKPVSMEHAHVIPQKAPVAPAPDPIPVFEAPPQPAAQPWMPPANANRWAAFEALGLTAKPLTKKQTAQQWLVQTYRGLGFAILTIIVVVLVGYIMETAFYFWNSTWVQPMVVAATDEKVLALKAQVAAQENEHDKIAAELTAVERELSVEQDFQSQFAQAIRADLEGRRLALSRVRGLAYQYAGARAKVQSSNSAYAAQSAKQMQQEYRAGLIDRSEMLSGKFQLAQITTSNLGLAEREAEFETRAGELDKEAKALEGLLSDKGGDGALSYDVLRIKQEYEKSRLATARAMAQREALRAALTRENTILDGLRAQPYLRAIADKATVAFIPYGNMSHVEKGTKLYACSMEMFWCHNVGTVREILPGEVQFKHPHREKMMRGQLVELDLDADEADVARNDVLFLGSRPLWL